MGFLFHRALAELAGPLQLPAPFCFITFRVDLALIDEGQQYGNIEETAAAARPPLKCLVAWTGDHRQTPGGIKKTDEAS